MAALSSFALAIIISFVYFSKCQASISPNSSLRVYVPLKIGFKEFVSWSGTPKEATFNGFSIEIFKKAIEELNAAKHLSYNLTYQFVPYGDGFSTPSYDDMIKKLVNKEVDVVVGDITITTERMRKVDFTQPYVPSTLVVVVPVQHESWWDFLQPLTMKSWIGFALSFIGIQIVILTLQQNSSEFQGGPLRRRLMKVFGHESTSSGFRWSAIWQNHFFSRAHLKVHFFEYIFCSEPGIWSTFGRLITAVWIVIFATHYMVNLRSSLTVQLLSSEIQGLQSLLHNNVPVGYQQGSFVEGYLLRLGIAEERLQALASETDFANALRLGPKNGGVAAIVDELPYVQKFLASEHDFTTVGNQLAYSAGFGFAFPKNSLLSEEVSMAILSLAQNGALQRLHDRWIGDRCSSPNVSEA